MISRREILGIGSVSVLALAGCSILEPEPTEPPEPESEPEPDPADPVEDESVHSIEEYGAEIDGETDDTEAVRAAMDAAEAGETVFFPAGTTLVSGDDKSVSGTAAIPIYGNEHPNDLTLKGEGEASRIQMDGGHERNHTVIEVEIESGLDGLRIENLTVDGAKEKQEQKSGNGGWNFSISGANDDTSASSIELRNIWSENANQNGFRIAYGGCVLDRCTATNCDLHGFAVDTWGSHRRPNTMIEVRNSYASGNGLYGIDCSGGRILVENFVSEYNVQGTKTTEEVIETTYRRCRFSNNETLGYNRPTTRTETGQRAAVRFDDVIAENNGYRGFRFGFDTDYDIGRIVARGNNTTDEDSGNISVRDNSTLEAGIILTHAAAHGKGFSYGSSESSTIDTLVQFANPRESTIPNTSRLQIDNRIEPETVSEFAKTVVDLGLNLDQRVPMARNVGAGTSPMRPRFR